MPIFEVKISIVYAVKISAVNKAAVENMFENINTKELQEYLLDSDIDTNLIVEENQAEIINEDVGDLVAIPNGKEFTCLYESGYEEDYQIEEEDDWENE